MSLVTRWSFAFALVASTSFAQDTSWMSMTSTGAAGTGNALVPSMSADGRYVAFQSSSLKVVAGDLNSLTDVFIRDRATGMTTLVSVNSNGFQSNGFSARPIVSEDGRFVVFMSDATNLHPMHTQAVKGVFIRDLFTGTTELVSATPNGHGSAGACTPIDVSADGSLVLFTSWADDLLPGDSGNTPDLFVRDRITGTTESFTLGAGGIDPAPTSDNEASISDDGRFVAFQPGTTHAASLRDRLLGTTTLMAKTALGASAICEAAVVCGDGSTAAFQTTANLIPTDTSPFQGDIYVYTVATGLLEVVSRSSTGEAANGTSSNPALSANGRFVFFRSVASNLVPGDTNALADGFVHDRVTHKTMRVSLGQNGQQGNGVVQYGSLRADGLEVAFDTTSSNFAAGDTNTKSDIYVRSLTSPATWTNYGAGFPGSFGTIPSLALSGAPAIGSSATLDIGNSAAVPSGTLLLIGAAPLALPTSAQGTLLVAPAAVVFFVLPSVGVSLPYSIPDDVSICGVPIYVQAIEQDAGAAAGLSFTRGLEVRIGS